MKEKRAHGVVFLLAEKKAEETLNRLAVREKGGYEVLIKDIICEDGLHRRSIVYVASRKNPLFIKDEDII